VANTPDLRASEGKILAVASIVTPDVHVPEGRVLASINFPTKHEQMSQAVIQVVSGVNGPMHATEAVVLAAVQGRIANPRIRAWTFTLDGHDFYVLRLGDKETLLYDVYSQQWVQWNNGSSPMWAVNCGMTWIGGQIYARNFGSNIVVGDDSWGLLWFLDPMLPYDQHPDVTNIKQQYPFDREVTGQVVVRGRTPTDCFTLFLNGDNYGIVATDFTPGVTLETSDDQGKTFDTHDTISVTSDTVDLPYEWYSLGAIYAPGRLFKITDNGVFTRIDSLMMNDDNGG
jgi:hypothetical protein